ncbi:hypothetical protein TorRG33x02_253330, partial [Trema orientale]
PVVTMAGGVPELRERVIRLEEIVGTPHRDDGASLADQTAVFSEQLLLLQNVMSDL